MPISASSVRDMIASTATGFRANGAGSSGITDTNRPNTLTQIGWFNVASAMNALIDQQTSHRNDLTAINSFFNQTVTADSGSHNQLAVVSNSVGSQSGVWFNNLVADRSDVIQNIRSNANTNTLNTARATNSNVIQLNDDAGGRNHVVSNNSNTLQIANAGRNLANAFGSATNTVQINSGSGNNVTNVAAVGYASEAAGQAALDTLRSQVNCVPGGPTIDVTIQTPGVHDPIVIDANKDGNFNKTDAGNVIVSYKDGKYVGDEAGGNAFETLKSIADSNKDGVLSKAEMDAAELKDGHGAALSSRINSLNLNAEGIAEHFDFGRAVAKSSAVLADGSTAVAKDIWFNEA